MQVGLNELMPDIEHCYIIKTFPLRIELQVQIIELNQEDGVACEILVYWTTVLCVLLCGGGSLRYVF